MRVQNLMHAADWQGQDLSGWIGCELIRGLRAFWDGRSLRTPEGGRYHAPGWFTVGLPSFPLDCVLDAGYGKRHTLTDLHAAKPERWRSLMLVIFDAPKAAGGYRKRLEAARARVRCDFAEVAIAITLHDTADGWYCCRAIVRRGGAGLLAYHPKARYRAGLQLRVLKLMPDLNDQCRAAFAGKKGLMSGPIMKPNPG